ncbi:ABC transporter permease [Pontibacter fetidus]|uniref:FtsX-like permease family protein n=1 Tax=Pontibacter fetidus TaxID=2700082 RepID=A0A6B2H449_9BACT|nr:ABC transporter permease [Pontibacter fetidus]NDK55396.1 FtsX-like permease family protein [Pontibacter fetidus]
MIRHLFKLIWNRKKSNFLLITEIFFCFLVLFGVLSFIVYNVRNYSKPLGFKHDNVWLLTMRPPTDSTAQNRQIMEQVIQRVRTFPQVEHASFTSSNAPFAFSQMNNHFSFGNAKSIDADVYEVQDEYKDVMQLNVIKGRWFSTNDNAAGHEPIVINKAFQQHMFGSEEALGKIIQVDDTTKFQVVGVTDYFRAGSEFAAEDPAVFTRINLQKNLNYISNEMLIRVKPGTGIDFEEKMMKEIAGIGKDWALEVATLEKMRQNKAKVTLVPMIALGLVCGFLILNVALGLFGVLWYNISRRNGEIGLRRALGAPSGQIYRQFIGEVLVLATFGLLFGVLFAVQFPLLQVFQVESEVYFTALAGAVVLIYLLTTICALYPSRQAAAIHPAVALHEE